MILRIEDIQSTPLHESLKNRLEKYVGSHRNDVTYLRNRKGQLAFIRGSVDANTEFCEIENSNEEHNETKVCDEWIVTNLFSSEKREISQNAFVPELIYIGEYSKIGEWDTLNSVFKVVEKFFAVKKVKKS